MEDREVLEQTALQEVCSCLYYDLADNIETATDEELQNLIDGNVHCDECR